MNPCYQWPTLELHCLWITHPLSKLVIHIISMHIWGVIIWVMGWVHVTNLFLYDPCDHVFTPEISQHNIVKVKITRTFIVFCCEVSSEKIWFHRFHENNLVSYDPKSLQYWCLHCYNILYDIAAFCKFWYDVMLVLIRTFLKMMRCFWYETRIM